MLSIKFSKFHMLMINEKEGQRWLYKNNMIILMKTLLYKPKFLCSWNKEKNGMQNREAP